MSRILEDEIAGDPLGRGYSAMTDQELLDSLNVVNRFRDRPAMTRREIADTIPSGLYTALSDAEKAQLLTLFGGETGEEVGLNPFGFAMVVIRSVFGPASAAVTALTTARVESISRGEEIGWGEVTVKSLRLHTISRAQG